MACVRDMNFYHPNSSKRHKELYKQLKPQPLSESEQEEALAQLKNILPNAPVFMADNTEAGAASGLDESSYDEASFGKTLLCASSRWPPVLWQGPRWVILLHKTKIFL